MYHLIWNAIESALWQAQEVDENISDSLKKRRLQKWPAVIVFQIKNIGGETLHDVAWLIV